MPADTRPNSDEDYKVRSRPHDAPNATPHVLVIAGEASGDMHGANLVRALRQQRPELRISAMGGSALAATDCELVYDSTRLAVVGLVEVLGHLGEILAARRHLFTFLEQRRPELLILIDYPDFNLMLAARAKKLGIKVMYYISPQVWAWRRGRVRKIRRLVDRMAVILPFEQEFYRRQGMTVDYVGHPLVDELAATGCLPEPATRLNGYDPADRPVIGLLPGSRRREIATMLPVFLAAARQLQQQLPETPLFLLPLAPGLRREDLVEHGLADYAELDLQLVEPAVAGEPAAGEREPAAGGEESATGDWESVAGGVEPAPATGREASPGRHRAMATCHAAMAASGTVTLELAIMGVPTVAAYRVSAFTYLVGRALVKVPHATLVNLVAGREVIPELLQNQATAPAISREIFALLTNQSRRQAMLRDLTEVRAKLGGGGASQNAATIALSLL